MTEDLPPGSSADRADSTASPSVSGGGDLLKVAVQALAESNTAANLATVEQVRSQGKIAGWPGGVLGVLGSSMVLWTIIANMNEATFDNVEYVATLVTGAVLALLGPLIIAKSASRTQESLQKMDEQNKTAEQGRTAAWAEIAARLDRATDA